MIISRTPLRMSFVGGGSDLPAFYRRRAGAVVSTAIDKYVYVNVNRKFDDGIRIAYSRNEEVADVSQIEHRLVRASMEQMQLRGGVEITTIADIPSRGTGLGSSSTFTVGLLNALNAFVGKHASAERLAAESCDIEIVRCGEPIGKQDQYAAAYGGFNLIEFEPDDRVVVSPIICRPETVAAIECSCLIFYTGITRSASELLQRQSAEVASSDRKHEVLGRMVDLAHALRNEIQSNNVSAFGEILHENWMLKKSLVNGITTGVIDQWYDTARRAGAIGGKILGAGAGGFLMFFAPPARHDGIREALSELRHIPVRFEPLGSRIIFYH